MAFWRIITFLFLLPIFLSACEASYIEKGSEADSTYVYDLETLNPPPTMYDGGKAHFIKRVEEIDQLPVVKEGILLAGDSITEAWKWHSDLLAFPVSNHGVSWDTAEGLYLRVPQILRHSPERIFILIGTNDIGYGHSAEHVASYLERTVRALRRAKPEIVIYLQAVLPRNIEAMPQVLAYNNAYKKLARDMKIEFVDISPAFAQKNGALKADLTDDNLHLNAKGYEVWAQFLNETVTQSKN